MQDFDSQRATWSGINIEPSAVIPHERLLFNNEQFDRVADLTIINTQAKPSILKAMTTVICKIGVSHVTRLSHAMNYRLTTLG